MTLVALLVMDAYVRDAPTPQNDELIYARMAEDPFDPHTFPFAFRIAVPTVVHVLPFDHEISFSLLAWAFTAGCASLTAVWADRLWDRKAALQTLYAGAPALIAYAWLRASIPTVARDQVLGYRSLLGGRLDVLRAAADAPQYPLRRMAYAFGPLWLAAPFAVRDLPFARRGLVLVAACVVAMTFALDWGRVIILAAPVVLVAAAWILNTRPRLAAVAVVAFFALDLGYVIYMEDLGGAQDGIIDVGPAPYEIR